jgi:uncharacterized hydrophobic protein (TIGR00271 family)
MTDPTVEPALEGPELAESFETLFFEGARLGPYLIRFSTLIVLSSMIAALGLLGDSAAVVIGAMLVAPLMTPILATAAAMTMNESRRLVHSIAVLFYGTILAVVVGWAVSAVASSGFADADSLPSQVLARTSPNLLDLGIAVAAGAAGGYVLSQPKASSALPGVGIAVALIPPLATVGISYQLGATSEARGAVLLYLTNLAAIIFSASVVFIISPALPLGEVGRSWKKIGLSMLIIVVVVVGVAIPLTFHTISAIEDRNFNENVSAAISDWDDTVSVARLDADVVDGVGQVELFVVGANEPAPAWQLASLIRDRHGGPVELTLAWEVESIVRVSAR